MLVAAASTQCVQTPAVELRRTSAEGQAGRSRKSALDRSLLPRTDRLRCLDVESRRCRGRAAPVCDPDDVDGALLRARRHLDAVSRADLVRGLHADAVHVSATAEHGLRCRTASLEEARRPEPLVDPRLFHTLAKICNPVMRVDRTTGPLALFH